MLGPPVDNIRTIQNPFERMYRFITIENNGLDNHTDLDPYVKRFFFAILKVILFLLYLMYWVPTRIILLIIILFEWAVATFLIEPILNVWFLYTDNQDMRFRLELRRKITRITKTFSFIAVTIFLLLLPVTLLYHEETYLPFKLRNTTSNAYDQYTKPNNWTVVINEYRRTWTDIEDDKNKLDMQIEQLQSEFDKHQTKIDSEQIKIWNELHNKQTQIDCIRKSLDQDIRNTMKESDTMDDKNAISLDSLSNLISDILNTQKTEELIQTALNKYHQDVLNKADFALKSRRARIIYSLTSPTYSEIPIWKQSVFRFLGMMPSINTPDVAISPQTHIGECWTMYGNNGTLGIQLSQSIIVKSITVEYPSSEIMSGNMANAPKKIELFGIINFPKASRQKVSLGIVEYDIHGDSTIQTFDLETDKTEPFRIVQVQIHSNWGSLTHTDLYRIRIHGILPVAE